MYTIGDCYVVMSFTDKDDRKNPEAEAYDVLKLAFKMIQIIAETRERVNFDKLKMRIGLHTVSLAQFRPDPEGRDDRRSSRHRNHQIRLVRIGRRDHQQDGVGRHS